MGRKGAGPRLWADELAPFPKILGATKDLGGESNGTGVCVLEKVCCEGWRGGWIGRASVVDKDWSAAMM